MNHAIVGLSGFRNRIDRRIPRRNSGYQDATVYQTHDRVFNTHDLIILQWILSLIGTTLGFKGIEIGGMLSRPTSVGPVDHNVSGKLSYNACECGWSVFSLLCVRDR